MSIGVDEPEPSSKSREIIWKPPTTMTTTAAATASVRSRSVSFLGCLAPDLAAFFPSAELAEAACAYFPGLPPQLMRAAVARYRALGIWGHNPILPRGGYEQLRASLVSGGFVRQGASFEQAVDNSLAADVVREGPPALSPPSSNR